MKTWAWSLLSVMAVSSVSLLGVMTLSLNKRRVHSVTTALVSFAIGALLGDAFFHLIPETLASNPSGLKPWLLILGGIMLFFMIEKLLHFRRGILHQPYHSAQNIRIELAGTNLIGDAVHNFMDGVLIGASYLVNPSLGVSTTIAVLLHEIPQELGDFGVLVQSGLSIRKAVLFNVGSASTAIVGTTLVLLIGSVAGATVTSILVPVTAGGFIYIAAELIPELQHDRSVSALFMQTGMILLGAIFMALLTLLNT